MKGYIAHWKLLEGGEVDYQVLGLATALLPGKKPGPCKLLTAIPTVTLQSPLSKLHPSHTRTPEDGRAIKENEQ